MGSLAIPDFDFDYLAYDANDPLSWAYKGQYEVVEANCSRISSQKITSTFCHAS